LNGAYREVRELISAFRTQVGRGIATRCRTRERVLSTQRPGRFAGQPAGRLPLGINEEFHVLQIVREAITNTVRHADAKKVHVALSYGQDHRVRVVIEDDGRPVGLQLDDKHYGLSIMRERRTRWRRARL